MRRTLAQLVLIVAAAGLVSCGAPSVGTEQGRLDDTLAAEGDVSAQPVHFPFRAEAPSAPVAEKARPVTVVETEPEKTPEVTVPAVESVVVAAAQLAPESPEPSAVVPEIPPESAETKVVEAEPVDAAADLDRAVRESKAKERLRKPPEDDALRLTLKQAIDIALERNLRLKQQSEAIAEAEARLREKQNEYGPRLQFDYTAWTWHGLFVRTSAADPDVPGEGTGRAQLTLYLPVWVARRAREAAVMQAMEEVKVRQQHYHLRRNDVIVGAVKSYLGVLGADEALHRCRETVELNRERLETLKILRRRGQILRNRLILGEKFAASAGEELKYREAERALAAARLRKHLDLPDSEKLVLVRPAVIRTDVPTPREARSRMRTDNPVLRRLRHERMSAYWTGRVRHYEEPRANIAIRYGASFPKYREFTDDFLTIGLSVNWPVAKMRLDRAKRDQARHRVRQLELEEDIVNDELDLDLQETHAAYLKSLRRLEAKRLDVSLAEENLRLSKVFRKHGTTDSQEPEDVFQVQVNGIALAETRMEQVKVKYEVLGLLADLYQRMGAMDELVRALTRSAAPAGPEADTAEVEK